MEKCSTTHAGLWLDKFLFAQTEDKTGGQQAGPADKARASKDDPARDAKAELIQEISKLPVPDGYREALRLREALFTEPKERGCVRVQTASTRGRLIIGLGQKGPAEVGLSLEHTWGVPVLPGSALKGLVAATAHQLLAHPDWHKDTNGKDLGGGLGRGGSLAALAGTIEQRGSVVFHDAWWVPAAGDATLPIRPDVMTVHHPEYYGGGKEAPSDMDSPIPVAFASVSGDFQVVVEKAQPDVPEEHLEAALFLLKLGLAQLGIGAKTNAGYGRMELDFLSVEEQRQVAERAAVEQAELLRKQQEEEQRRAERRRAVALEDAEGLLRRLSAGKAAHDVPRLLAGLAGLPRSVVVPLAKRAIEKLGHKRVHEQAQSGQSWAADLLRAAE